jgi:IS5 family transposase
VIEQRRRQRSFADGFIAEAIGELGDDWLKHADRVLDDDQLVATVYRAL